MITTGQKLLIVLRKQRLTFERLADGTKRIFDPIAYNAYEEEALELQRKIIRENKKNYNFIHKI